MEENPMSKICRYYTTDAFLVVYVISKFICFDIDSVTPALDSSLPFYITF